MQQNFKCLTVWASPLSCFVICQGWKDSRDSLEGSGLAWLQCCHEALRPPCVAPSSLHNSTGIPESSLFCSIPLFRMAVIKGKVEAVPANCRFSAEVEFEASPLKPAYYRSAKTGLHTASLCYAAADIAALFFSW